MGQIKLISWDVYGTIIASGNDETSDVEEQEKSRARPRALEAIMAIRSRGISQITSSDSDLKNLKASLKGIGIAWQDYFDDLYQMVPGQPKDFSQIIQRYNIQPENLLVIGDREYFDINLAKKQGCAVLHVPEERSSDNPIPVEEILKMLDKKA